MPEKTLEAILEAFSPWGFWGLFAAIFVIFGLKEVAGIIEAVGNFFNQRKKIANTHERAMRKIENQNKEEKEKQKKLEKKGS